MILWTSLLDTRFNLSSSHWRSQSEKDLAINYLTKESQNLAIVGATTLPSTENDYVSESDDGNNSEDFSF